jgi:hypothetical protein
MSMFVSWVVFGIRLRGRWSGLFLVVFELADHFEDYADLLGKMEWIGDCDSLRGLSW